MNSSSKKAPEARGIPQPFNRQAGHAPRHEPVVAQLKTGVSAQSVKRPVAPPVYRPQPTPKVLQTKSATSQPSQTLKPPRQPVAPPVYRPQPTPKVLQRKASGVTPPSVFNQARNVVQASWWINKKKQLVGEYHDGEDSVKVPEVRKRVVEKLNEKGARYKISNKGLTKEDIKGDWERIDFGLYPAEHYTTEMESRSKKLKVSHSTALVNTSPTPEDPLSQELLVMVLQWAVDVKVLLGKRIATEPSQLAKFSLVCKRWNAIIRSFPQELGYYLNDILMINQKVQSMGVPSLKLQEERGIAFMAKQLVTNFPPSKYTYVSLGNSPAIIIELIQQCKSALPIIYVPISNIEGLEVAPKEKNTKLYETLLDYVGRLMGDRVKTSHILLVDMTMSGAALGSIKVLLDDYYSRKNEQKTVEMLSLNPMKSKTTEELEHLPLKEIQSLSLIDEDSKLVADKIVQCRYKNDLLLKMFGEHAIMDIQLGTLTEPQLSSAHYQRMRETIKRIIKTLKLNQVELEKLM